MAIILELAPTDSSSGPLRFELTPGGKESVSVGRNPKSDVLLDNINGISWLHTEFRIVSEKGAHKLVLRDGSTNGTGVQAPGSDGMQRLAKGEDTDLPDGSMVKIPMKVKGGVDNCKMFTVKVERPASAAAAEQVADDGYQQTSASDDEDDVDPLAAALAEVPKSAPATDMPRESTADTVPDQEAAAQPPVIEQERRRKDQDVAVPDAKRPRLSDGDGATRQHAGADAGPLSLPNFPLSSAESWPLPVVGRVHEGRKLVCEGHDADKAGRLLEAFDNYRRGCGFVLEVLPSLAQDDQQANRLRQWLDGCFDCAANLKDRIKCQQR